MAEQLQVQIGANIRDLQSKLKKATRQLDRFKLTQKSLEATFKAGAITSDQYYNAISKNSVRLQKAGNDIKTYKNQLTSLSSSQGALSKSQAGVAKSSAHAQNAMLSFSQTMQDAPYGIRGVANNIQQLTLQMGYLNRSAGGTGNALKAMLGTLAGPAGILLAVSAVTSLFVAYGDEIAALFNKTNALNKATKEFLGTARSEIALIKAVVGVAKDETKSKEDREKALKFLNDKYPKYLENLDLEKLKSEQGKIAVDDLTKSLIRNAQIKGIQKLIEEKSTEYAEAELKAKSKSEKVGRKQISINQRIKGDYNEQRALAAGLGEDWENVSDSIAKIGKKKVISTFVKEEVSESKQEIQSLTDFLQQKLSEDFSLDGIFTSGKKKEDDGGVESFINDKVKAVSNLQPITVPVDTGGIATSFTGMQNIISTNLELFKERLRQFNEAGGLFVDDLVENGLGRMGEAIGSALVNGNNALNAIGGVLLSTIGDIAVRLGKTAIGIGIAMKGIKLSFKSPGVAIAAGVALVAIGSAMKSAASIVSGQGGSGSGYAGSQDYSGSNVTNTSYGGNSSSGGRVVFEIAGDKLIGVLNNTSLGNLRIGDSSQLITTG